MHLDQGVITKTKQMFIQNKPLEPIKTSFFLQKRTNRLLNWFGYEDSCKLCEDSQKAISSDNVFMLQTDDSKIRLGYLTKNSGLIIPSKICKTYACSCAENSLTLSLYDVIAKNNSNYLFVSQDDEKNPSLYVNPLGFVELSCEVANSIILGESLILEDKKTKSKSQVFNSVVSNLTLEGKTLFNAVVLSDQANNFALKNKGWLVYSTSYISGWVPPDFGESS